MPANFSSIYFVTFYEWTWLIGMEREGDAEQDVSEIIDWFDYSSSSDSDSEFDDDSVEENNLTLDR